MKFPVVLAVVALAVAAFADDPMNYELYTKGGIEEGLKAEGDDFTLNGQKIRLLSGSLHYFRLPQKYWRDRLRKFRAAGLNTVQTYVPWNLHEEVQGKWDFKTDFLNLEDFLIAAKEEDLFVFFRPGPYICAEWEFGGYPAWLLKDRNMHFRSAYQGHLDALESYYIKIMEIVNKYTFQNNGSVIALQFENEYGGIWNDQDQKYFDFMKDVIEKTGFKELLTNCDNIQAPYASEHTQPGVLETLNGNDQMYNKLMDLKKSQPNKPLHVTEFWPGWFNYWGEINRHGMTLEKFTAEATDIIFKANSSINYYMFFGGTNFGFTNGANDGHTPVITSYDYDAPLSESGNYTPKYWKTREMITQLFQERDDYPKVKIPEPPQVELAVAYGDIKVKDYINFADLVTLVEPKDSTHVMYMEDYDQQFGYIVYRTTQKKFKHLTLPNGLLDIGIVLVDGKEKTTVKSEVDINIDFEDSDFGTESDHILDVMVENTGRTNGWNLDIQRRGLKSNMRVDDNEVKNYQVFSLDFKPDFNAKAWEAKGNAYTSDYKQSSPILYRAILEISGEPKDTFIRTDNWTKGIVIVNNINIGRYNSVGPQRTLYLPAPYLKSGENEIQIFELHSSADRIQSVDTPDLGEFANKY